VAATGPASIPGATGKRIVGRIRRAARARLRAAGPRRATLVVRATDRSGNRRTAILRIALRRGGLR
jgi:hypothetical protein